MTIDSMMQETIRDLRILTNEERRTRALSRIHSYATRPSTIAADAFFGNDPGTNKSLSWKTLPRRIHDLCQVLEGWVRTNESIVSGRRCRPRTYLYSSVAYLIAISCFPYCYNHNNKINIHLLSPSTQGCWKWFLRTCMFLFQGS